MINKNSGYAGWSMSKRAVAAYEDGEMPKSKWTKDAMLAAIAEALDDEGIELTDEQMANLEKMPKAEMFTRYFSWSSWHHTSKHCNATDFYGLWTERVIKDAEESTFSIYYEMTAKSAHGRIQKKFSSARSVSAWFKRNGFADRKAERSMWRRGSINFMLVIGVE